MSKGLVNGMLVGFLVSGSVMAVGSLMAPPQTGMRMNATGAEDTAEPEVAAAADVAADSAAAEPAEAEMIAVEEPAAETEPAGQVDADPSAQTANDAEAEPAADAEVIVDAAPEPQPEATPPAEAPAVADLPETASSGDADASSALIDTATESESAPASPEAPTVYAADAEPAPDLPETTSAAVPESPSDAPAATAAAEAAVEDEVVASVEPEPAPETPEPAPSLPATEAEEGTGDTIAMAAAPEIGEPGLTEPAEAPAAADEVENTTQEGTEEDAVTPEAGAGQADKPVILTVESQPLVNPDAPQPGFSTSVPGVKINRLPSIGDAPDAADAGAGAEAVTAAEQGDQPAVERYAASFDNPDNKPLIGVILIDIGDEAGGLDPAALAASGLPVTIAIDPLRDDAGAREAAYRAAGLDVGIFAPELPAGASATDLEVSYQAFSRALPETVALIGRPDAVFQSDRRMAQHLVALLGAEGRGLVTYDRGLNPAQQAAFRGGLAHASVYRELDAAGESAPAIARYLDRASFEAARQGEVLVIGTSAPATVQALKDWAAAEGKESVIGPLSAVFKARQ